MNHKQEDSVKVILLNYEETQRQSKWCINAKMAASYVVGHIRNGTFMQ